MPNISFITKKRLISDEETFTSLLPYATFDENYGIFVHHDTSLWCIFQFIPRNIVSCSDEDSLEINRALHSFIDSLEEGISVQFSTIITFNVDELLDRNAKGYPSDNTPGFVAQKFRDKLYRESKAAQYPLRCRSFKYILAFRFDPPWRTPGFLGYLQKLFGTLFRTEQTSQSELETQYKFYAEKFVNFVQGKVQQLSSIGLKCTQLKAQDFINLMYPILNARSVKRNRIKKGRSFRAPAPQYDPNDWLSNQINETPLYHPDHGVIKKDGRYFKVVSMAKIPRELQPFQLLPLFLLDYENIVTVTLSKESFDRQIKKLETLDVLLSLRLQNPLGYNQKLGTQYRGIKEMLQELYEKKCQLVRVGVHQILIGQTKEEVEKAAEASLAAFSQINGARGMVHDISDLGALVNALPAAYDPITDGSGWTNYMRSSLVTNLLPIYGNWKGSDNKLFILPCLWGRELIGFDFYDSQVAPNVLISGVSGAGKSYLLNYLILNLNRGHFSKGLEGLAAKPPYTFIFDKGMQGQPCGFAKLAELLKGRIYEATPAKAPPMNFLSRLSRVPPDPRHEDYKDLIDLCSDVILDMANQENIDRLDRVALIETLKEAHLLYHQGPKKREFILSDVVNTLRAPKKIDESEDMAKRRHRLASLLYDFYGEGTYSRFFDRPGKLDLAERFIVFDLKALSRNPDLQRVFLKVAMLWADTVMNDPRELDNRKILVFDEAHDLIGKTSGATVETAFRLYRKRKGIVIAASQSGDDFYAGSGGQAIVQNSAFKIFLRQDPGKFRETAKLFGLSQQEVSVVLQLKTVKGIESQFFMTSDLGNCALCLPIESYLYWISTNNGDDNQLFFEVYQKVGGDIVQTINILAKIAPFGARPGSLEELKEELSTEAQESSRALEAFKKGLA